MNRLSNPPLSSRQQWPRAAQRAGVRTVVAVAAGVLGGVVLDRAFTAPSPRAAATPRCEDARAAPHAAATPMGHGPSAAARAASSGPLATVPTASRSAAQDMEGADEDVQAFRARQTAELMGLVRLRLRAAQASISGRTVEGAVNQLMLYQTGLLDGALRAAPELAGALSDHIGNVVCDSKANPAMQVSVLRMIAQSPELGSERAFDCVLQSGRPEDHVLWAGLDALGAAQLPRGAELERLASTAKDERTKQRLARLRDGTEIRAGAEPARHERPASEEPPNTGAPLEEEKEEP